MDATKDRPTKNADPLLRDFQGHVPEPLPDRCGFSPRERRRIPLTPRAEDGGTNRARSVGKHPPGTGRENRPNTGSG